MRTFVFELLCVLVLIRCSGTQDVNQKLKACRYDSDCTENAYCKEQSYCQCKDDFIAFTNASSAILCLKGATKLDDPCIEDIQCTKPFGNHASCNVTSRGYKACACMTGAHFKGGRCYTTSRIGEKCVVSDNCHLESGLPAYCERSTCKCHSDYHPTADGRDCIRTSKLDEPCTSDQECITQNSKCGEVCRCKVNYIQSHNKDACIKAADNMGDPCEEEEQCTMFLPRSTCGEDGRCQCLAGLHYIAPQSKCYRNIMLGEMCEENAECIAESAECKNGRCQCEDGYHDGQHQNCVSKNKGSRLLIGDKCSFYVILSLIFILIK